MQKIDETMPSNPENQEGVEPLVETQETITNQQYRDTHSEIPWQMIIGMRNRLVHEYFDIIPERVWDVVERDIPELIRLVEPLVPPDEPSQSKR